MTKSRRAKNFGLAVSASLVVVGLGASAAGVADGASLKRSSR